MTRAFTLARTVGLACLLMAALPLVASAQELRPCNPIAPGVRCIPAPAGPWANLDFGMREQEQVADPASAWSWHPQNIPFRSLFHHPGADTAHAWWMEIAAPAPVDCKMAKHGDPAVDPKMVVPPPPLLTHGGHSPAVNGWFAPCKSK